MCEDGHCKCEPGWIGDECDVSLRAAAIAAASGCPFDCSGHGSCLTKGDVRMCSCEEGWSGPHCTVQSPALPGQTCNELVSYTPHWHPPRAPPTHTQPHVRASVANGSAETRTSRAAVIVDSCVVRLNPSRRCDGWRELRFSLFDAPCRLLHRPLRVVKQMGARHYH